LRGLISMGLQLNEADAICAAPKARRRPPGRTAASDPLAMDGPA